MRDIVLFTHVYRTGGMAVFEYLKQEIGEPRAIRAHLEQILPAPQGAWEQTEILVGHFPYGTHHFIPWRNPRYVTFVREPADRILSHWFSDHNPERTFDLFVENARDGRLATIDNMMTRTLSSPSPELIKQGHNASIIDREITWSDLEQAKQNLESHYLFVGTTEDWAESMRWLCTYFDWPDPKQRRFEKDNASKFRPRDRKLPDDVMEVIYRREIFDAELYRFGRELAIDYLYR